MARFLRHYLLSLQFFTRVPVTGRLADWVGFSPDMLRASAGHWRAFNESPTRTELGIVLGITKVSAHLHAALHRELDGVKGVKEIRGQGLMIGIDLDRPCGVLMQRALDAGLLLSVTADSVVRLVPPLIITETEADEVVAILVPLIQTFLAEAP